MTDEQRELYEEFFEFVKRVNNRQLNDSVFDRYFSKKIKIEQSKIIADKIIGLVEDAGIYELPLYGELNRRLKDIRFEMEVGHCYPERIKFMKECLECVIRLVIPYLYWRDFLPDEICRVPIELPV